jgi:glycosyltransferase involved in cell wall biosynthesis
MNAPSEHLADYWVMVPFYSNIDYLRQTMQSVLAQTDPNWRAVIVDDSPTDRPDGAGVQALVDELRDDRITSVRNPVNLGVAGSFNRCFEIATRRGADLAIILHADDLLEPDYVATVRTTHAAVPGAACVAPRVAVIGADGALFRSLPDLVKSWLWPRRLDRLEGQRGLRLLLRGQFFYCPAVSYRLSRLTMPAWDQRWMQVMDLELYGRILLRGGSIALEPAQVFRYRRHEQSMTQQNSVSMVRTVEETAMCRLLSDDARRRGWSRAARAGRWRVMVRLQSLMRAGTSTLAGDLGAAWRALALAMRP